MSGSEGGDAGPVASGRLIECCPAGCSDTLMETSIVLPEGPLRRCQACASSSVEVQQRPMQARLFGKGHDMLAFLRKLPA